MRRTLSLVIVVATISLSVAAAPALADDASSTGTKPDKVDALRHLDIPHTDHAVALDCRGAVTDRGPAVHCGWRAEHLRRVAHWQLWRLQIRPETDERTLVAELGPDAGSYTDTRVTAPAAYLYVILGLDDSGEIVARSRPDLARVVEVRPAAIDLACHLERLPTDAVTTAVDEIRPVPQPAISCRWDPIDHRVKGYVVYRADGDGPRAVIAEVGPDVNSIVDRDIAFGHRYAYAVTAIGENGEIVAHSRVSVVGVPPWPHDRPTDVVPYRVADVVRDHQTDRVTDAARDQVIDRVSDAVPDRVTDMAPDRPLDRASDRVAEHDATDSDSSTDNQNDRVTDAEPPPEHDTAGDGDRADTDH